nr:Zinc finger, CCHC-type [Ipomoea batatas]
MSANESDDEELEPIGERQKDDHSEEEVQEDDALNFNCVVHKALSTLVVLDQEEQRENIFYGKCKIPGATCSFIIDGGSCTNVISEDVVNAMKIPTIQHPQPYKLQWLNDDGELKAFVELGSQNPRVYKVRSSFGHERFLSDSLSVHLLREAIRVRIRKSSRRRGGTMIARRGEITNRKRADLRSALAKHARKKVRTSSHQANNKQPANIKQKQVNESSPRGLEFTHPRILKHLSFY